VFRCPSCGQQVEGGTTCPRCGASLTRRLPLRLLQYAALIIAIGGLAALVYAARWSAVPHFNIGDVGATQNLAYVEISGLVVQPPKYNPEAQSLSFRVDDGTGDLLVSAFRAETTALIALGRVPAVGDRVTVQGTLRVREDFAGLTLNAADALKVEHPAPIALTIGAINSNLANQAVDVTARVVGTRSPYAGLTLITLQDPTGQIDAALDETTRALTGDPPAIVPGDVVRVSGVVTLFRDAPQLTLTSAHGLAVLPPDTNLDAGFSEPEALTPLSAVRVGAEAKVEGAVAAVESFASGFKFVLNDGSGTLTLVLRDEVYRNVTGVDGLRVGARVRAFGLVEIFNGEMEITPTAAGDIAVLTPGRPAEAMTRLNTIGLTQVGQTLTIAGEITAVIPFSKGTRLMVGGPTGTIVVLLWENVLAYVPESDQLAVGQSVTVTGTTQQFQGAMEIVPQIGFDVIVK
jgi:DNA/RNA endonuclease YhcR with UshA esterase domain